MGERMQKFELAGMLAAFALMTLIVGLCWPAKRTAAPAYQHITTR